MPRGETFECAILLPWRKQRETPAKVQALTTLQAGLFLHKKIHQITNLDQTYNKIYSTLNFQTGGVKMRKESVADKIKGILFMAAMVLPPWNVFWWFVGLIVYAFKGGRKNDPEGELWRIWVVYAPVLIPSIPFIPILDWLDLKRYEKEERRIELVNEWLTIQLAEKGIKVVGKWSTYLRSEVRGDQLSDFQTVYAEAIRAFPKVDPIRFCARAEPPGLLGREWAKRFGFKEYQGEQWTAPCYGCQVQTVEDFLWGDDTPRNLYVEDYCFVLKPEFKEIFQKEPGYICKECRPKYCNFLA